MPFLTSKFNKDRKYTPSKVVLGRFIESNNRKSKSLNLEFIKVKLLYNNNLYIINLK